MTDGFERFTFKPWMGYLAGATLLAAGWDSKADLAILTRSLGVLVVFGTSARSHHLHRKRTGGGWTAGELQSVVFAGLSALLALALIATMLMNLWKRLVSD